MTPDTCVRRTPHARAASLGEETVLLHLARGTYSTLNPTGSWIWERLAEPASLGALHADLLARFEVDAERAWDDLEALVGELAAEGLVVLD